MAYKQTNRTYKSDLYNRYLQNGYYSHTSQAYQVALPYPEEEEYPEERPARRQPVRRPAPTQKPHSKPVRRKKVQRGTKKAKTVYKIDTQNQRTVSPTTFVLISVIFLGILAWLSTTAYVDQKHHTLQSAQTALRTLQYENRALETDIMDGYDLKTIEQLATTRLGMVRPADYQVIHVSVPRTSYSVQFDTADAETPQSGFNLFALFE